jgi:hypothetical protein
MNQILKAAWIVCAYWLITLALAARAVTLAWDASPGAIGYKLYYGTQPTNYITFIDVGNVLTNRITNLVVGVRYYFAVTAYTASAESVKSAEIFYDVAPLPPLNLRIAP